MDPSIRRVPAAIKLKGRELQLFHYERPFDQRYISHLLDVLLSVVRFGGQGFAKTAHNTPIKRSYQSDLVQKVEASKLSRVGSKDTFIQYPADGFSTADPSYMEVLIVILLR
jgi:hypothetical protein